MGSQTMKSASIVRVDALACRTNIFVLYRIAAWSVVNDFLLKHFFHLFTIEYLFYFSCYVISLIILKVMHLILFVHSGMQLVVGQYLILKDV